MAADGKPVVQGIGARREGGALRVGVLHVAATVRKGRLRVSLHDHERVERVTCLVPERVRPGAYERVTLEVAE